LKPGDELDVTEGSNSLVFSATAKDTKRSTTVSFEGESETFLRINLNALYSLNYDSITVLTKTQRQAALVQELADNRLLGFEITKINKGKIVIENVSEPSSEKQGILLKRMFFIINESFDIIREEMTRGKFSNVQDIQRFTHKVNQYDNFCRRNTSKRRFTDDRSHFYWSLYRNLLHIQHSLLHLYQQCGKNKSSTSKPLILSFEELSGLMRSLQKGFFEQDQKLLYKVHEHAKKFLHDTIYSQLKRSKGQEAVILHYYAELSRLIYLATAPMLGVLL